jgi:hypothetical protein
MTILVLVKYALFNIDSLLVCKMVGTLLWIIATTALSMFRTD